MGVARRGNWGRAYQLPVAEKLIVYCLACLFPKQPITSVEMFDRMDKRNRREMLGTLIGPAEGPCKGQCLLSRSLSAATQTGAQPRESLHAKAESTPRGNTV
jgi:hypothetical protein